MSSSSRGLGRGQGRIRTYQVPMPSSVPEILQVIAEELQVDGIHSVHVEEGRPISIERYTDPDDLLNPRGTPMSPQEVLRQVDPILDAGVKATPFETLLFCLIQLQQIRMNCAGLIFGNIKHFTSWLNLDSSFLISMQSLDRSCDYEFLGHRMYLDNSLDDDRLIVLGGESTYPTLTSVHMAIQIIMELPSEQQQPAGEGRDGAGGDAEGCRDLRDSVPADGPKNQEPGVRGP